MQKPIFLLSLFFLGSFSQARTVDVVLEATPEFIQHHTAALMLGVRQSNGAIVGSSLFTSEDLRKGVQSKRLTLDDNATVVKCTFEWLVMDQVPGAPVKPNRLHLPKSYSGSGPIPCVVNEAAKEIRLSLAPLTVRRFEAVIPADALANRKARFVHVSIQPVAKSGYPALQLQANEKLSKEVRETADFFAEEKAQFKVQTLWLYKNGESETTSNLTSANSVEIK